MGRCQKCNSIIAPSHGRWLLPPPPGTNWANGCPYQKCQGCGPFSPTETRFMHGKLRSAQKAAFAGVDPVIPSAGCNCTGSR